MSMSTPDRISKIIGNRRLIRVLQRSSLPQSVIFAGRDGIGKQTTALLVAALANCFSPQDGDLCGTCASCIKALQGNHPDIRLIEPETAYLKIDQMRQISREAHFRPFEGHLRFFIIDQAEKMTTEAANSLLKTLEEPPSTSRLILVTPSPKELLSTIQSRCQTFHFLPLNRSEIEDYLRQKQFAGNLRLRASISEGSLGEAIRLDMDHYLEERDRMFSVLESWVRTKSFARIFAQSEAAELRKTLKNRESVRNLFGHLELLLYDLHFLMAETPERVINLDREKDLKRLEDQISFSDIQRLLESVARSKKDLARNVSPLICFETLWLDSSQIG